MILIADSGSTKCDWVVLDSNNKEISNVSSKGINPILLDTKQICDILYYNKKLFYIREDVETIMFYGAGCGSNIAKLKLKKVFVDFFPNAKVTIEEDLMAAVHGTTTEPGVICILGTGSNCCYYDGQNINVHQASLGYVVMDEGSGNYFGKKLLNAYYYNKMPEDLRLKFGKEFDVTLESVLKNLYEFENPSAYLAKYSYFLVENISNPFILKIITLGIKELFDNLISCYYKELKENPLHFVGSIGFYLQEAILKEAKERRIKISSFVKRPMDNIIKNYSNIKA